MNSFFSKFHPLIKTRRLKAAEITLGSALLISLASSTSGALASPPPSGPSTGYVDFRGFRDIFVGSLSKPYTEREKQQLIYLPTHALLKAPQATGSGEEFFSKLDQQIRGVKPLDLFHAGATPENAPHPWNQSQIEETLSNLGDSPLDRVTFVVASGVFADLVKTFPFAEVTERQDSAFKTFWNEKLLEYRKNSSAGIADDLNLTDTVPNLAELTPDHLPVEKRHPIESLIELGSIDDAKGRPLVNVIVLPSRFMGMESIGGLRETSARLSRRMRKVFAILGIPKNIALIGYSRGGPLMLDLAVRAKTEAAEESWFKNLRGVVTLGGVNYGAASSNEATNYHKLDPAPQKSQMQDLAVWMRARYKPLPERKNRPFFDWLTEYNETLANNGKVLIDAAAKAIAIDRETAPYVSKPEPMPDVRNAADPNVTPPPSEPHYLIQILFNNLRMQNPVTQYNENIYKAFYLFDAGLEAVKQLSTGARLQWWRENILPTHGIRYYALTGAMTSSTDPNPEAAELAKNTVAFNWKSPDDLSRSEETIEFAKLEHGMYLNDSLVANHKARFWPEARKLLNPNQPPYESAFLGVLGTHHWGMALQTVKSKKYETWNYNPFPRADLLKALGTAIAHDIQVRNRAK